MTKFTFLFLLCIPGAHQLAAQTITVLQRTDKKPVHQAHVVLSGEKNILLLTDTSGKISIPAGLHNQRVAIQVSHLGFEKISDTLVLTGDRVYYLQEQQQVLNEVAITAQYAPNSPEKAVHRIRIIDRKKIDAMGAQNLRDALTNELNIRLAQDNILGSSMALQGLSGENVKILIDGVPVTGRQNGNIDLSQINLAAIERIEIVEGPLSVNYGTNALAGTINLITKKTTKGQVDAYLNTFYETVGHYNINAGAGIRHKKSTLLVSGGRNFFDGWKEGENIGPDFSKTIADSSRFMQWKPKEQYFSSLQYLYRINRLTIQYKGDFFTEKILNRGYPRAPYGENAFDDAYRTRRMDNAVFITAQTRKNHRIQWLAAYNDYTRLKNTWFKDLTTLAQTLTENSSDQDTSHFALFNSRGTFGSARDSARLNYEAGYDINIESGNGQRIESRQKNIQDYALFASAEITAFKGMTLRPGLRVAHNSVYTSPVIPSVNLRYQFRNLTVRSSWATGFRAPALKELFFYFVDINHNITGNPALQAEKSSNYTLSFSTSHQLKKSMFRSELSLFYNNISNLITLAQVTGTGYTYINIGRYKTNGIQATTEWAIRHIKLSVGAAYTGRYSPLENNETTLRFNYSPEWRGGVYYEIKKWQLTLAAFYKYTGRLPLFYLDENSRVQQAFMQDYQTADITATLSCWKKRINLGLGCKNLFDVRYIRSMSTGAAHSDNNGSSPIAMGRSYFLKLEFRFNKP